MRLQTPQLLQSVIPILSLFLIFLASRNLRDIQPSETNASVAWKTCVFRGIMAVCNAMLFKYEHVTSSRRDEWILLHDSGKACCFDDFDACWRHWWWFNTSCHGQILFQGRHPYWLGYLQRFTWAVVFRKCALEFYVSWQHANIYI